MKTRSIPKVTVYGGEMKNAFIDLKNSIAVRLIPRLRRRRRALEILTHIKCTIWQRQNECHYWQPSDAAALSIIMDALMKVWAAE